MYKLHNKEKYNFLNLKRYGAGKGINIATVETVGSDDVKPFKIITNDKKGGKHAKQTALTCLSIAPDSTLFSLNSNFADNIEYILKNNIKIIFSSTTGEISSHLEKETLNAIDYLKSQGVIFFNAAGNNDMRPEGLLVTSRKCINIGTVDFVRGKISHSDFGRRNDFTDFASFGAINLPAYPNPIPNDDYYVTFIGTSFSTPIIVGIVALIIEDARKQGIELNQEQVFNILKDNSKMYGLDKQEVGNGVIQLPDVIDYGKYKPTLPVEKLPIENGGNNMKEFKDVDKNRWSYKAIEYCVDNGLMKGYSDGTFRPKENVTREELAQVLLNQSK